MWRRSSSGSRGARVRPAWIWLAASVWRITGQSPFRTGLTKIGVPGADIGLQKEDPTIAELLKPLGYATGQFGKNHLGTFRDLPPRQRPASFNVDQYLEGLTHGATAGAR